MKVEFHSDKLHDPLSKQMEKYAKGCDGIDIATGFLSKSGLSQILEFCKKYRSIKKVRIVCGAITASAIEVSSMAHKSKNVAIKIDFPYFARNGTKGGFSPMMHSKVYIFHKANDRTSIVGSSNLSFFAMEGKNVEANTITSGDKELPLFKAQQAHFNNIWKRGRHLNHRLAVYYDTLFKRALDNWTVTEFHGNVFQHDHKEIHSIFKLDNSSGIIPKINDTIIFLQIPRMLQDFNNKDHLFYIGNDNYMLVNCIGGYRPSTGAASSSQYTFKIKKTTDYEISPCGPITISPKDNAARFQVIKLLTSSDIVSGEIKASKYGFRTAPWIIDHLKFDPTDTISIRQDKFLEDVTDRKVVTFEKIIGFKESNATKIFGHLITQLKNQTGTSAELEVLSKGIFFEHINDYEIDFYNNEPEDLDDDLEKIVHMPEILVR